MSKAMSLALRFRHSFESRFFLFMFPPSFVVSSLQTGPNGSLPVRTKHRCWKVNSTETPKVHLVFAFPRKELNQPGTQAEEINGMPTSFYGEPLLPQDRREHSGADKIKIAWGREQQEKRREERSENERRSGIAGGGQSTTHSRQPSWRCRTASSRTTSGCWQASSLSAGPARTV